MADKKNCVSCGKKIPAAALDCVWCRARQPAPDLADAEVLGGAVERAKQKEADADGGGFEAGLPSATNSTLIGIRVADLTAKVAAAAEAAKPVEPAAVDIPPQARATAAVATIPAPAPAPAPAPIPATAPAPAVGDQPWVGLGRGLMGAGGLALIAVFFMPWHGVSSWQLLETLAGADFVRQLFYLTGGIVLVSTALLPLPFVFRAAVGAVVAALPVVLGADGIMEGWRGVVAALAILGLPATHLLRSRAQSSSMARALVVAAVAAVVLLYLAPTSSLVPIAAVLKMIASGSIGLAVMGLFILVPLVFAGLSLLGVMGRDLTDVGVLLSVLILLWAPLVVALRGLMIDDGTQLYVAFALLCASAIAAVSLAQLLSLAARGSASHPA
jgi:hypothetical protein